MTSATVQEALLAELLGDVGKLHDQIKALPARLEETVQPILKQAEEELPFALETKTREIEATVAKILAASDHLETERKKLIESLKLEADQELQARIESYATQVMVASQSTIKQTFQSGLAQATTAIQTAAREVNKAQQGLVRNQLKDMFLMGSVSATGGLVALLAYITFFQ